MNSLKILSGAALLATLAACTTVGPDYKVPEQAVAKRPEAAAKFLGAQQESAYKSEPLPKHWWRLYDDPVLDQLIEQALAANTDLRVAAANLERTRAVLDQVEEARKPDVSVGFEPMVGRISGVSLAQPEKLPDSYMYNIGVNVSYQTDMFGKIKRAVEAADADTQAAQAAVDVVRVTVAADTAHAYADACSAVRQITVAENAVDLQQKFVKLTDERIRAGRGTAIDAARARSQLAQMQSALPPLQAQHRVAYYRLAALTGKTPQEMNMHLLQCQAAPRLTQQIPVGDGTALLRRRPDIRQAERNLASATARIGVATADLYPNIELGASVGSTGLLDHFGAGNAFRWSLGPLISWTLPNTGTAHSRIKQAEAGTEGALAKFDGTVLNALKEVESTMTVYARELDRNAALKTARDQSALASEQSHKLYQYGRTDFLSVLDADRTLAATDAAWAASDAALAKDQIALFLALGGGWEPTKP
ncbi:efflux transporter outer membrane subunit [Duganella sp. FT80W]|uniref:Efflux transporter outer membrane subunit n=1 Tax=Duganella guangzhouensis TaxID=2666084 RepID=A0A6I2L9I2_9BURK|nr:efflux transporter outer membrane subunit [Duganella guangzhouensis]MRW94483.1 efflux transporter outer membrane subunit [Duganella guangzhouensis]